VLKFRYDYYLPKDLKGKGKATIADGAIHLTGLSCSGSRARGGRRAVGPGSGDGLAGSAAWRDALGLRVGDQVAGAHPDRGLPPESSPVLDSDEKALSLLEGHDLRIIVTIGDNQPVPGQPTQIPGITACSRL